MAYFCSCCRRRSHSFGESNNIELTESTSNSSGLQPDQSDFARQVFGEAARPLTPRMNPTHSLAAVQRSVWDAIPVRPYTVNRVLSEMFRYESMVENTQETAYKDTLIDTNFSAERNEEQEFIYFICNAGIPSDHNEGWKLHIAVDDHLTPIGDSNLANAWNRIKDILMFHQIHYSKIVLQKNFRNPQVHELMAGTDQRGKQITIYRPFLDDNDPRNQIINWKQLILDIEYALRAEPMIARDLFNESDRKIEGSWYISYRNDYNPTLGLSNDKRYLDAKTAIEEAERRSDKKNAYNPFDFIDPFERIRIQ